MTISRAWQPRDEKIMVVGLIAGQPRSFAISVLGCNASTKGQTCLTVMVAGHGNEEATLQPTGDSRRLAATSAFGNRWWRVTKTSDHKAAAHFNASSLVCKTGQEGMSYCQRKFTVLFQSHQIVAIGRNYADHVKELRNTIPKEPFFFLKPTTSYVESGGKVEIPRGIIAHHEGTLFWFCWQL
jgi:2-keto-4-pentenoate hydratase/2-oxohepta-3-ene-1,7-dioic acid hydratase in catechol pathway